MSRLLELEKRLEGEFIRHGHKPPKKGESKVVTYERILNLINDLGALIQNLIDEIDETD